MKWGSKRKKSKIFEVINRVQANPEAHNQWVCVATYSNAPLARAMCSDLKKYWSEAVFQFRLHEIVHNGESVWTVECMYGFVEKPKPEPKPDPALILLDMDKIIETHGGS